MLRDASYENDLDEVRRLLLEEVDVNEPRSVINDSYEGDGATALIYAALNSNAEVVSLLIAAGAEIDAKDNDGATALLLAALHGYSEVVSSLIASGADVNAKNNLGGTPLIAALLQGHPKIADYILTHGKNVDVSAMYSEGLTARDCAEMKGYGGIALKLEAAEGSLDTGGAASIALCVVCLERPSTAALVHKSAKMVHRCCCEHCAEVLRCRGDACPMCRRPIDAVVVHFH